MTSYFTEDVMINKHRKRCSMPSANRRLQIKAIIKHHSITIKMSKIKNDTNHSYIADGNIKWKQVCQFPQNKKNKHSTIIQPSNCTTEYLFQKMKTHVYRKIMCLQIFIAFLFVITRSRWPSNMGEYLNKPYTTTTRQQKVTTIDTICINLKIMLSVKNQPPKVTN